MDKTILLIFKIVSFIFIALAVILQVMILVVGEDGLGESSVLNNYVLLGYAALGLTAFLSIIFPIIFMIQNPKNALKLIIALAIFGVIGFICYSIADNTFNIVRLGELKTTVEISKMVGAALYFTYIVGSLAVLTVIFSGVSGIFR